jgi:hypothetical protein
MRQYSVLQCAGIVFIAAALGAGPASQPDSLSTAPALTPRQQDLLLQLSDAEANIQAINKALTVTGYKVGVAYNQIDSSEHANDTMNRKGGGPVRWDEFYGKTARDYPRTGFWDDRMDDHRPRQFAFVYKANQDQISRAKDQIASLQQNQQALLDRRKKHEDDQSRLWATLAWEQVEDRETQYRPLYRYPLKPEGPEAKALAPVILFLKTAAGVAHQGLDTIQNDQDATFHLGKSQLDAAYAALEQAMADALDPSILSPAHVQEGLALKELCKGLDEEAKVITDDYSNARDRDAAKEDDSKLQFRGQLQSSLSEYATQFGKLDDEIGSAARGWSISPDRSAPATARAAVAPAVPDDPAAPFADAPAAQPLSQTPAPPAETGGESGSTANPQPTPPVALASKKTFTPADKINGDLSLTAAEGPYTIDGTLAAAPGVKKFTVSVGPGVQVNGGAIRCGGGQRMSIAGTADAPAIFRQVTFEQSDRGYFKAQYAIFYDCKFRKVGAWYDFAGNSTKWEFEKCLIRGADSFARLTHVDYGVKFDNCTFQNFSFDDMSRPGKSDEPADYMKVFRKGWRTINSCRCERYLNRIFACGPE